MTDSNRPRPTARKSSPRWGTVPFRRAAMISRRRSRLMSMGLFYVKLPFQLHHIEFDAVLAAAQRQDLVPDHVEQPLDVGDQAVQPCSGHVGGLGEGGR